MGRIWDESGTNREIRGTTGANDIIFFRQANKDLNDLINKKVLSCYNKRRKMKKLHLPMIIELDEDGYYIVSCPLFKGCHTYGETIDEALENIKEVIQMCLEETDVEEINKFIGFRELEIVKNA